MTVRRIFSLIAVFIALMAACFLVWKREQPERPRPSPLLNVPVDSISRIDVAPPGATAVTLVRKDGQWRLSAPADDLVDPRAVEPFLTTLREFSIGSVVSESEAHFGRYEVTSASATRLTIRLVGSEMPVLDVLIGKASADTSSSFIRFPDDKKVRTGDGLSAFLLRVDAGRLRQFAAVPVPFGALTSLSGKWKGGDVALTRSSDTWMTAARKPVKETVVSAVREGLLGLRASRFDEKAPLGESEGDFTFAAGTMTITHVVLGAEPRPATPDALRRISVEGRPSVLLVPETAVKKLLAALKAAR